MEEINKVKSEQCLIVIILSKHIGSRDVQHATRDLLRAGLNKGNAGEK